MDSVITPTNFAANGAAATQVSAEGSGSNSLTADFETFLRLLTTQMKNQDPTNPQDSTEFISQLAGFSAVEQQVATNTKLQELVDTLTVGGMSGLSTWIGADVRSIAAARFDEEPIELAFTPPQDADVAYVSVKDERDVEVATIQIATDASKAVWDGNDFTGTQVEPGLYTFNVIGLTEGTVTSTTAAETYSKVTEVRAESGEIVLIFEDGTRMKASEADYAKTSLAET